MHTREELDPQRWLERVRHVVYAEPSAEAWSALVEEMERAPNAEMLRIGLEYASGCLNAWPASLRQAKLEWVESLMSRKPNVLMGLASSCDFPAGMPRSIVSVLRKDIGLENIRALSLSVPDDRLSVYVRRLMGVPLMNRIEELTVHLPSPTYGKPGRQQDVVFEAEFASLRSLSLRGLVLSAEGLEALCLNPALRALESLEVYVTHMDRRALTSVFEAVSSGLTGRISVALTTFMGPLDEGFWGGFSWPEESACLALEHVWWPKREQGANATIQSILRGVGPNVRRLEVGAGFALSSETVRDVVVALDDPSSRLESSNVLEHVDASVLEAVVTDESISIHARTTALRDVRTSAMFTLLRWDCINRLSPSALRMVLDVALDCNDVDVALRAISCMCGRGIWTRTMEERLVSLWDEPRVRVRRKARALLLSSCIYKKGYAHKKSVFLGEDDAPNRLKRLGWGRILDALEDSEEAVVRAALGVLDAHLEKVPQEIVDRAFGVLERHTTGWVARRKRRFEKRLKRTRHAA